jgi:hypothetical protein
MAEESKFVAIAFEAARKVLKMPFSIHHAASLLYEVTIDNNLTVKIDPRKPVRGASAFQTDLCIFEKKSDEVMLPRVVMEFKTKITTHDILTYSAKARKHKQVYPYLRYGLIASDMPTVPRRFFVHNESLDFCATLSSEPAESLEDYFEKLITAEVAASGKLENVIFGNTRPKLFRSEILFE